MIPEIAPETPHSDLVSVMRALQSGTKRWTTRRKVAAVLAEAKCHSTRSASNTSSVNEVVAWERDYDRYGVPGLRPTRYQIYRQTEAQKA